MAWESGNAKIWLLSVLVALSGLFIGLMMVNVMFFWLAQVALILLIVRFRYYAGILPAVLGLVLALVVYHWSVSVVYGYLVILPGLLMGYKAKTFDSPRGIVTWGMLPYLAPVALMIVFYPKMMEQAPTMVAQTQAMIETGASQLGISGDQLQSALVSGQKMIEWILRLAPGIFFTIFLTLVLFAYLAAASLSRYFGAVIPKPSPLFIWKAGEAWLIPLGASLIFVLVGGKGLRVIGENMLVFLVNFYAFFGICFFDYYFHKANISLPIRLIIYIIFLMAVIVAIPILALLAVIDSRFDFRKVSIES